MATKPNKPATAVFVTGVRDAFKTVDAYKQRGVEPITSVTGLFEQAQADLVGALRGGKQSGIGIPLFGKIGLDGKININKDALISRALTFGASLDIGKSVSSILKFSPDSMVNSMLGTFNQAKEEVYVEIDGVRKPLEKPGGILSTVNSIGQSINAFTGTKLFNIKDASGQEAYMKSLIIQGLKDGIPNTFKSLTKSLTDPRTIRKVAGNVLGDAIKSIDIKNMIGTGGIASVLGRGGPNLRYPMITRDFSGSFAAEAKATSETLKGKLEDIKDLYSYAGEVKAVEGENTGGKEVHYAAGYASDNEEFKKVVKMGALGGTDPNNEEILVAAAENGDSPRVAERKDRAKTAAEWGELSEEWGRMIENANREPDAQVAGSRAKMAVDVATRERDLALKNQKMMERAIASMSSFIRPEALAEMEALERENAKKRK